MNIETRYTFDFVVIGSGVAGLSSALKLSKLGNVAVLTKRKADDTKYCQSPGWNCMRS